MSVSASWLNPGNADHRRVRQLSRQRELRVTKLVLVPASAAEERAASVSLTVPTSVVVPAQYESDRAVSREPRRSTEVGFLLATAIAVHLSIAWWALRPEAAPLITPPQVPIEVVLTQPPVVPPMVKSEPPKPTPVKKLAAPAPRVDTPLPPDAIAVPPPPQHSSAMPAPVVEKLTEARADADYLQNPAPAYPGFAQRQGWEGTVWLHVLVKPDGTPAQIELEKSSGRKVLDDSALAAVKNWRFVPAKRGDTAVDGWVSIPIEFKLGK